MTTELSQKIESAFQKIEELIQNERDVEINGQKMVLGIVSGAEEDKIQGFLSAKTIEEEDKLAIVRIMKIESLVYAIKSIDDTRLDKLDFFSVIDPKTSEEQLIEKPIFLRDKLMSWPSFIVNYLFNQYVLLVEESSSTFNPEFKVEGLDELLKMEVEEQEEALKAAEEREEDKPEKKMEFREIPDPEAGGVMDQTGR